MLNIEDIHFEVTCPACGKTFGISSKLPYMERNCRCNAGGFQIRIGAKPGKKGARPVVKVQFIYNNTQAVEIQPENITTQGD